MTVATYNELITATFRHNAIRSVMMIDDDFVPYRELCDPKFAYSELHEKKKLGITQAAKMHDFFQAKKMICDIDNGVDHIEIDKIRKCDLIILDYHLEKDNPQKSIQTIHGLSNTDHMNLVVVYTSEELDKVWMNIACSLFGTRDNTNAFTGEPQKYWDEKTNYVGEIPEDWTANFSLDDLTSYILTGSPSRNGTAWFGRNLAPHGKLVLTEMCELALEKRNLINTKRNPNPISGQYEKWLHLGNVFVVLYKKSTDEAVDQPAGLWNAIETSLSDWKPSYYRLLISEMQNQLENEPISFKTHLGQDLAGQAAWLHDILKQAGPPERKEKINQLFDRLAGELKRTLFNNQKLQDTIERVFSILDENINQPEKNLIEFSATHVKFKPDESQNLRLEMGHALNFTLCARHFDGEYITNGTVLYDGESRWYLCVAPACETIPIQLTGQLAKRLKPHRLMKVLVLENIDIEKALNSASDSWCIFIKPDKKPRIALSVLNPTSNQPSIDYVLVKNHNASTNTLLKAGIDVIFFATDAQASFDHKETKLTPMFQLREGYAARFQSLASNHAGRIGVDFVNFEILKP